MPSQPEDRLLEEIADLRQQVMELTISQTALEVQCQLLEEFVTMARSPNTRETGLLKAFLKETLTLSTHLTGAERGSLLLTNATGEIEDAIFTNPSVQDRPGTKIFNQVLDRGVAGWIRQQGQAVLITDTRRDERWVNWLDEQHDAQWEIRSVLGVPLLRQGRVGGVLTLLHSHVAHFTTESLNLMMATATQMAIVLENAQLYGQLHNHSQSLNADLDKGRQIQLNFLPSQLPQCPGWELAARFQPAYQVAGDFYDAFELPSGQIGLVIADVCDKGVGAALFMGLFRSLMRIFSGQTALSGLTVQIAEEQNLDWSAIPTAAITSLQPLQAICLTNDYIAVNHGDLGMFATLFFGILNPETGILNYASGGHEPLWVLDAMGTVRTELKATGPALGIVPQATFRVQQTQLSVGDVLLGYTDGVTEARSVDAEFLTPKRLKQYCQRPIESADQLLEQVLQYVLQHTGLAQPWDDITLLAVRRRAQGAG